MPERVTRRGFLKRTAAAAGAVWAAPLIVRSSVLGAEAPSNQIQVGSIGVGGRGAGLMYEAVRASQHQNRGRLRCLSGSPREPRCEL